MRVTNVWKMRVNNTGRVLKYALIISIFASVAFGQATLTARDVINKMAGVYAQSATYRDEGQVTFTDGRILSFKTLFERPTLFKFEFTNSGQVRNVHYVLWRTTPGDVRMWATVRPQVRLMSMHTAIVSVTGVSAASGHNVPVLLMPEGVTGFSLSSSDWMDSTLPEEDVVDGRACYKISGHFPNTGDPLSVWIDKQTFLIRKIVDTHAATTYAPQLNIPIDAALFDFEPPAANPTR
jgi:hypothetical protein